MDECHETEVLEVILQNQRGIINREMRFYLRLLKKINARSFTGMGVILDAASQFARQGRDMIEVELAIEFRQHGFLASGKCYA